MPSRDYFTGQGNLGKPGFSISGGQFGQGGEEVNGKTPTVAAPMIINNRHAGEMGESDDLWQTTFGSSLDAFLSLMNGRKLQESIDDMTLTGIFKDGMPNADDDNLYKKAADVQQIQFVVSGETVDEGIEAQEDFGEVEDARSLSFRMPAMVTGWGKKINLIPTDPTPADDENLRKNDDSHKLDRATWKTGPLDVRWDPRRGVWAAFNDMIADHNELNLGTWIFGTNNDESHGFPFIRGRLEDVFWVRQTPSQEGTDGHNDDVQTGEVLTHLNHRWYDDEEKGAAPLRSIFIIPNKFESGDCHDEAGHTTEVGDEETGECERIDLRSTVHFWKDNELDGPFAFCGEATQFLAPIVEDGKYIRGEFIFDKDHCKWLPAVLFDECEYMGGHIKKLIENDGRLGVRLSALCNDISAESEGWTDAINVNGALMASNDKCIADGVNSIGPTINTAFATAFDTLLVYSSRRENTLVDAMASALNLLANSINTVLLECGCPGSVESPGIGLDPADAPVPPTVTIAIDCEVTPMEATKFDCDRCIPVKLQGPCMTQPEYTVGEPCGGATDPEVETLYGKNQFHDPEEGDSEGASNERPPCGEDAGDAIVVPG